MTAARQHTEAGPDTLPRLTERHLLDLLHLRYTKTSQGSGVRYVRAQHVRSHSGFDARRTLDFVAVDAWESSRFAFHGHEIKTSRSDWLREMRDPDKAGAFLPYMNYWWIVAAHTGIAKADELPDGWGLLVATANRLRVCRMAVRREAEPMPKTMTVALLRAVAKTAGRQQLPDEPTLL